MSKLSDIKKAQGYVDKAIPRVCMTCSRYRSDIIEIANKYGGGSYTEERNKRCGIGGFAVKKMATCDSWEPA